MERITSPPQLLFLFLFLLFLATQQLGISQAASASTGRCPAAERAALLEFKRGLQDPSRRLSSWVGQDCCAWEGVGCSNNTGRVTQLDLSNGRRTNRFGDCSDGTSYFWTIGNYGCRWALLGSLSPSLLSLQHLRHLDLSGNFFEHRPIPAFLGSLTRLTYLNLSGAGFGGTVPDQLGNLSDLHHLDLSYNVYVGADDRPYRGLYLESTGWISRLTSLRYLNMDWVSFTDVPNWVEALNALPSIQEVYLLGCGLVNFPLSLPHVNFTSLRVLDLSSNDFNSSVPNWLFNITSLEHLDSRFNQLNWPNLTSLSRWASLRVLDLTENIFQNGFELAALSNLCKLQALRLQGVAIDQVLEDLKPIFTPCLRFSLEELELRNTQLNGSLPDWLASMKKLRYLDLSANSLYGSLPASIGTLSSLQYLDLGGNNLEGEISEGVFGPRLQVLRTMYLDGNSLILSDLHLANLSSLKYLELSFNTIILNGSLTGWIPSFQLENLFLRGCSILPMPHFPKWLQTQQALYLLDMASADIEEAFPSWLPAKLQYLYLGDNRITGNVPQYLSNITYLDLSNNFFSGKLPSNITEIMPVVDILDLSMNDLTGSIPSSICQIKQLIVLRLAKNNFSGEPPDCWKKSNLIVLDLSSNNLRGGIPSSFCSMKKLQLLQISRNNFSGQIPTCLKGCTRLIRLDLSYNHLAGDIPPWIEETLLDLGILNLRSNAFTGSIPLQLSRLQYLQILDLSNNNLSGIIPSSFGNFSSLQDSPYYGMTPSYRNGMPLYIKGSELEYDDLLKLVKVIDLSNNGLSGFIPLELGNLNLLQSLNISGNHLVGEIPQTIDGMQHLEVLDLSRNNLSGKIPSSLASLTFLNHLNLSYNNLSGRIPSGNQLQTLVDPSIYIGNQELCGFPLPKNCTDKTAKGDEEKEDGKDYINTIWLYASTALGFIVGVWAVWGTLILKRTWRFAYFRSIDSMCAAVAMKVQHNSSRAASSLRRRRK